MKTAFTASRYLSPDEERVVASRLAMLCTGEDLFVTGGCVGGDQFIATQLHTWWPNAYQVIILPGNLSRVDTDWVAKIRRSWRHLQIIQMPPGTSYQARNFELIQWGERLIAFPRGAESQAKRSGSWQTVRLARAAGIPISTTTLGLNHDQ